MLSLRLLRRNMRSQEVQILALAVILAVALVSAIALFADRLESAMLNNANQFLAADRQIKSSTPIPAQWIKQAQAATIEQAQTTTFSSMVFVGDNTHLASVKAVSDHYPLLGELAVALEPFSQTPPVRVQHGPGPGEVWVEGRLFPLLGLKPGDELEVGDSQLTVTRVLVQEPDRGQGFVNFGARVMMNQADLAATGVIQPGSRVSYRWLLSGPSDEIDQLIEQLNPPLSAHQQVIGLQQAQGRVASNLSKARSFLMLASVFGLLLAGVAVAIAAQRFCARHVDQVALLKSMGMVSGAIRGLYVKQMMWLCLFSALVGLTLGWGLHWFIANSLAQLMDIELPPAGLAPLVLGLSAGIFCLLLFALPPLWPLPKVAPIKVLRREMPVATTPGVVQLILGWVSFLLLLWLYTRDVKLSVVVSLAWGALALACVLLGLLLLRVLWIWANKLGRHWRLAVASLRARRAETLLQMVVFGSALMLLVSLLVIRGGLLDEWRNQLPADAPNHFVANIAPHELNGFETLLASHQIQHKGLYPLVRGRLIGINGQTVDADALERQGRKVPGALRRELNLSWTEQLPEGNILVAGSWWPEKTDGLVKISVEQSLAQSLAIELGDWVSFSIGGLVLETQVTSIRSLHWDSLTPNFYVLFEPGALRDFSPMYMTSFYAPDDGGKLLASIVHAYPAALVIEMDKIFDQIRKIVDQVSGAVELVFWLVLAASVLVLLAAVAASMEARIQELGLLRALGAESKLLRQRLWLEFSALGAIAGLLAAMGAEGLLLVLQAVVFKMPINWHPQLWALTPLLGALIIGLLGAWRCRHLLRIQPAEVLRASV